MIAGVADHAALWYLLGSPRLSDTARRFIDDAAQPVTTYRNTQPSKLVETVDPCRGCAKNN